MGRLPLERPFVVSLRVDLERPEERRYRVPRSPPRRHKGETVQASEWQQTLRERAEGMRRNPTRAEAALWRNLRRRPGDMFFWTQHVIGSRYIADFYCPAARLVIEVDGDSHADRAAEDRRRDDVMHEYGFRVMRLTHRRAGRHARCPRAHSSGRGQPQDS